MNDFEKRVARHFLLIWLIISMIILGNVFVNDSLRRRIDHLNVMQTKVIAQFGIKIQERNQEISWLTAELKKTKKPPSTYRDVNANFTPIPPNSGNRGKPTRIQGAISSSNVHTIHTLFRMEDDAGSYVDFTLADWRELRCYLDRPPNELRWASLCNSARGRF